ncbi:MAG: DUF1566 domain-containing protein [Sulfurovum sp.]|nr:DUF1566 domain-containing protein [Sulfurovum sp.]
MRVVFLVILLAHASDSSNSVSKQVTINIINVNDDPPVFTSSATANVVENTQFAIDLNASGGEGVITYSIAEGNSTAFEVNATTGVVAFLSSPDYDNGNVTYTFTASADDGLNVVTQEVTITIIDEDDESPVFTLSDTNVTVEEEQLSAINLTATDIDTDDSTLSYRIAEGNASSFSINTVTGEVTFLLAPDYESGIIIYTFNAYASDGTNTETVVSITINISDLFETRLKKTGQVISYNELGNEIVDDSIKDDGFYQSGQITTYAYARSETNNTVIDKITGLMWQDDSVTLLVFFDEVNSISTALDYCTTLGLDGYFDWRLPSYNELKSILDYSEINPSIDTSFENTDAGVYWTSILYADTSNGNEDNIWTIRFSSGIDGHTLRTLDAAVRCVRDN